MTEPIADPRCAAFLSTDSDTATAAREVAEHIRAEIGTPDLAFAFVSHHHGPDFETMLGSLRSGLGGGRLLGCTGESIIGGSREVERAPALGVWAARLPGSDIRPVRLSYEYTPDGGAFLGWPEDLNESAPEDAALLLLADPFTFPADALLERLDDNPRRLPVIGGMASGAMEPGIHRLFFDDEVLDQGAIGVVVGGSVRVRSLVSQGCRPFGRHFVVTKANRNQIEELGGKPALEQLKEAIDALEPAEQELLRQGLHVGRVIDEYRSDFDQGDFLVRNVLGADPKSGVIAVADYVKVGQSVQFHLRDAGSATAEFDTLLSKASTGLGDRLLGALLFTCNGRGTRLFGESDHDAGMINAKLGSPPVAGFFAQGEIGPVGGRSFLHGFTASVALFERKEVGP